MLTHRAALCGGSAAAGAAGYVAKGVKAAGKGLKYAKGLKNSTKLAKTGKAAKATVKGSSKFFKAVSKIGSKGDDLIRGIRAGAGKMKIVASGAKRYADDAVRIVTNGVAKGGDTVVSAFKAAGKKFASVAKSNVGKIDDAKDAGKRIIGLADDLDNYDYLQSNKVLDEIEDGLRKGSKSGSKTYQTYTKTNPVTGEVYSGRTSGTGTPIENVRKRDANHHMNDKGFGPAVLDKTSDNYEAIRGREQMLIDYYGGAKSNKPIPGTSGNAINGIGPNNKKKDIYINAAKELFGVTNEKKKIKIRRYL